METESPLPFEDGPGRHWLWGSGPLPFEEGSHLHWLWGWGLQLHAFLSDDLPPSQYDSMIFLPDDLARNAMMHFSIKYPHVIKQIDDYLDFADARFSDFRSENNESTREDFVGAMLSLCERIRTGVEVIAKEQLHPKPATGGKTRSAIRKRERSDTPPEPASAAGNKTGPMRKKPKRSTVRGEGRIKLIAALTKHHEYADDGCLNLEPIGNNELARQVGVDRATASAFFKKEFEGHTRYRALCGDATGLVAALKLLNQEFSPHHLFGGCPPGEAGESDK